MRKPFNLEHAVRLVRRMNQAGIRSQACFVLGYPGETDDANTGQITAEVLRHIIEGKNRSLMEEYVNSAVELAIDPLDDDGSRPIKRPLILIPQVARSKGKAIIVGAGVTGLSAAWQLTAAGMQTTVLEATGRVGGMAETFKHKDFLLDQGPHKFFSVMEVNYPDVGTWQAKLAGRHWWFFLSVHLTHFTQDTIKAMVRKAGFGECIRRPHYQSLELAHLMKMGELYSKFISSFGSKVCEVLRIGKLRVPYYASQTNLMCRKPQV